MMCLYVENRRWEYNPGIFFLTTLAPAYIRWAMWTIQEILLSSVSLGILHYTAMWGGQGDQHVRGQEREKKGFRECCRFLSDVLSLSFTHFWTSRYWDCTLMRIMEMHMRNESPATKHKIYLPLCLGLPPPLQICQVSDTCSAAASKSQLHWGSCSLVWWSVSRCQSCVSLQDMRYGNRRALSGRTESEGVTFSRQKLANRERESERTYSTAEWETHCGFAFQELISWDLIETLWAGEMS